MIFGKHFDQIIIGHIPATIKYLAFGYSFDRPIINGIPDGVTHLIFGVCFNQSIVGALPASIKHLVFGRHFNQSLDKYIPRKISSLHMNEWNLANINLEQFNMTHLTCQVSTTNQIKIPHSVTHLNIFSWYATLSIPESVTHLSININKSLRDHSKFIKSKARIRYF